MSVTAKQEYFIFKNIDQNIFVPNINQVITLDQEFGESKTHDWHWAELILFKNSWGSVLSNQLIAF